MFSECFSCVTSVKTPWPEADGAEHESEDYCLRSRSGGLSVFSSVGVGFLKKINTRVRLFKTNDVVS